MAWSADTCILSFRGTSSFTNVLADLQVRTPAPCLHAAISMVVTCHGLLQALLLRFTEWECDHCGSKNVRSRLTSPVSDVVDFFCLAVLARTVHGAARSAGEAAQLPHRPPGRAPRLPEVLERQRPRRQHRRARAAHCCGGSCQGLPSHGHHDGCGFYATLSRLNLTFAEQPQSCGQCSVQCGGFESHKGGSAASDMLSLSAVATAQGIVSAGRSPRWRRARSPRRAQQQTWPATPLAHHARATMPSPGATPWHSAHRSVTH